MQQTGGKGGYSLLKLFPCHSLPGSPCHCYPQVCDGTGEEQCQTVYETSCNTKYLEKEPGRFVADTSCEKLPVEICGAGCNFVEGEEVCRDSVVAAVVEVPEEVCDLNPQKVGTAGGKSLTSSPDLPVHHPVSAQTGAFQTVHHRPQGVLPDVILQVRQIHLRIAANSLNHGAALGSSDKWRK